MRPVEFWSEGTLLRGDIFEPPGLAADGRRPGIVLCHGWGGTKQHLHSIGLPQRLAEAGFVVLAFDYRGWGESESRVVVLEPLPKEKTEASARVRVIREVVDPFDEAWDIRHAIDFLQGEPSVDPARIGLWGSSYGGGLVVWLAAHDDRVRCVVSQVAVQDSRALAASRMHSFPRAREEMRALASAQARGEAEPIPQSIDATRGLRGTPHSAKMYYFAPVELAERITVPVLLIDAEHEELWDRTQHSKLLYERLRAAGRTDAEYVVIPGITHYAVYGDKCREVTELAVQWFQRHL
ncbi:MAG TPA: alpha/beta fold hydrolase [Dehalococcoidia bacterium]|nr:alpha/beta fold hydrolase [Dehalococcoidia bacterium]